MHGTDQDAFHRLIGFGHAANERALPVWKAAMLRSDGALQWLKRQPRVVFGPVSASPLS